MRKMTYQRYGIQSEINVVPFLDVLLVLLIVFMILPSKFIQGFEVNLPNSTDTIDIVDNKQSLLTIEIRQTGLYNVILHDKCIKNIYLDQLNLEIRNRILIDPNITCLLAASKTIRYDEIIKILNLLQNIGVHSIGMMTNPNISSMD